MTRMPPDVYAALAAEIRPFDETEEDFHAAAHLSHLLHGATLWAEEAGFGPADLGAFTYVAGLLAETTRRIRKDFHAYQGLRAFEAGHEAARRATTAQQPEERGAKP